MELPGVDMLNLRIQKYRTETGATMLEAVDKIGRETLEGRLSQKIAGPGRYVERCTSYDEAAEIVALTCLRAVQRLARYPALFERQKVEAALWLSWVENHIVKNQRARK